MHRRLRLEVCYSRRTVLEVTDIINLSAPGEFFVCLKPIIRIGLLC